MQSLRLRTHRGGPPRRRLNSASKWCRIRRQKYGRFCLAARRALPWSKRSILRRRLGMTQVCCAGGWASSSEQLRWRSSCLGPIPKVAKRPECIGWRLSRKGASRWAIRSAGFSGPRIWMERAKRVGRRVIFIWGAYAHLRRSTGRMIQRRRGKEPAARSCWSFRNR